MPRAANWLLWPWVTIATIFYVTNIYIWSPKHTYATSKSSYFEKCQWKGLICLSNPMVAMQLCFHGNAGCPGCGPYPISTRVSMATTMATGILLSRSAVYSWDFPGLSAGESPMGIKQYLCFFGATFIIFLSYYTVVPLNLTWQALCTSTSRQHTNYNWNAYAWASKIDLPGAEFSPRAENLEAW